MKRIQSVIAGLLFSMLFSVRAFAATENDIWAELNRAENSTVVLSVESNGKVTDGLIEIQFESDKVTLLENSVIVSDSVDMYSLNAYQNVLRIAFVSEEGINGVLFEIPFEETSANGESWVFSGSVHGKDGEELTCALAVNDHAHQNPTTPGNNSDHTNPGNSDTDQTNQGNAEQNAQTGSNENSNQQNSTSKSDAAASTENQSTTNSSVAAENSARPTAVGNTSSNKNQGISSNEASTDDTLADNKEEALEQDSEENRESIAMSDDVAETKTEIAVAETVIENELVAAADGHLDDLTTEKSENNVWVIVAAVVCLAVIASVVLLAFKKKKNS